MSNRPLETYSYGISREWEYNNKLVIIRTQGDMSRAAVDMWADVVWKTLNEMYGQEPLFCFQDLSHPNQHQTPYANGIARQILASIPRDQKVYASVVLKDSLTNRFFSFLLRTFTMTNRNFGYFLTTSSEEAYQWITKKLAEHGYTP